MPPKNTFLKTVGFIFLFILATAIISLAFGYLFDPKHILISSLVGLAFILICVFVRTITELVWGESERNFKGAVWFFISILFSLVFQLVFLFAYIPVIAGGLLSVFGGMFILIFIIGFLLYFLQTTFGWHIGINPDLSDQFGMYFRWLLILIGGEVIIWGGYVLFSSKAEKISDRFIAWYQKTCESLRNGRL